MLLIPLKSQSWNRLNFPGIGYWCISSTRNHCYNQRTTHSCSCCWVNEVCPVACGPQREAHFLRTAHKLQRGENAVGRCFNIASQIQTYNNNSEMWLTLWSSWSLSGSAASSRRLLLCVTVTTVMGVVGADGNNSSRSDTHKRTHS